MSRKVPIQPYEKPITYKKYKRKNSLSPGVAVLFLVALWYALIGKDILPQMIQNVQSTSSNEMQEEKRYYEFLCSEAHLARLIALTSQEEENAPDALNNNESELWYDTYYQILERLDIKNLKKEEAFNPLTGEKLQSVLQELFQKDMLDKELQQKDQLNLYEVLIAYDNALHTEGKSLEYQTVTLLATPADEVQLDAWTLATDQGKFYFEGLIMDPLKGQTLQVATWKNQLLGVMEIESEKGILKECKIVEIKDHKVTFEVAEMTFTYEEEVALEQSQIGRMGQLELSEGKIVGFISEEEYEMGTGKGLQNAVRVVLSEAGNYEQKQVQLVGKVDYDVMYQDKSSILNANTIWDSETFNWESSGTTVRFVPRGDSTLSINTLLKGGNVPSYKGVIEVTKTENGYVLVNEIGLEDYVAGVIPSEMPTSYGVEALKAQAVAARTYVASALSSSKFSAYNAQVDDTTASQVYNQIPANEIAYEAAKTTAGLVLKSGDHFISNKFFASSCGYTANFGEVWAGQNFPSQSPQYLMARPQYIGDQLVSNLDQEENFKQFIKMTADDMDAFDEESPWFRWEVTLTEEELENLVFPALKKMSGSYTDLITYTSKAGTQTEGPIENLGKILGLKAQERGQGGNLMTLVIEAENGKVNVSTEYLIRSLFSSNDKQGLSVKRSNATIVNQLTLLPSAFFTIEQSKDTDGNLKSITLIGGGNGHGVGLSQDGAKGMAERGYDFKKILNHYYPEAELVDINA